MIDDLYQASLIRGVQSLLNATLSEKYVKKTRIICDIRYIQ